jgi:uncharacterized Zn-binding protein involved in type VI secretion
MPGAALKGGKSTVAATDGDRGDGCAFKQSSAYAWHWNTATTQASDKGSSNVLVNGVGAVRDGDTMGSHPDGDPCTSSPINHAPGLSTFSPNVFVNGKAMGRIGDKYDSDGHYDHVITSGSKNVNIN